MRWYRPATVPQRADLIAFRTPFGDNPNLEHDVRAAYAQVGIPQRLDYRYAGEPEGTFFLTRLADPRPAAGQLLPASRQGHPPQARNWLLSRSYRRVY